MRGREMMSPLHVLVFAASLREDSLNSHLARQAARLLASHGAVVDLASLREFDVPLYDGDAEELDGVPAGARELARRLARADAFVIASPEYNASLPGVLKNLLDWASRLRPQPFDGHHALLLSASPSLSGGNRGLWALRVPLEQLGTRVFPDMYSLASAHSALQGDEIVDPALRARLERSVGAFLDLVEAARFYPRLRETWRAHEVVPHAPLVALGSVS
jgi:chromate reductase